MPVLASAGLHAHEACGEAKLGLLLPVIDAILKADRVGSVKQRHTAKRIFERLRDEHDYGGGYGEGLCPDCSGQVPLRLICMV